MLAEINSGLIPCMKFELTEIASHVRSNAEFTTTGHVWCYYQTSVTLPYSGT